MAGAAVLNIFAAGQIRCSIDVEDGAYGNFVLKYTPIFYVFYDPVFEIHGILDVI